MNDIPTIIEVAPKRAAKRLCAGCERLLPESAFARSRLARFGILNFTCRQCAVAEYQRQYRAANKEAVAEYQRQYRAANKEAVAERQRQYRAANKEAAAEYQRQYYAANKEAVAERQRQYRAANKEAVAERQRQYRAARLARKLIGLQPIQTPEERHQIMKALAAQREAVQS